MNDVTTRAAPRTPTKSQAQFQVEYAITACRNRIQSHNAEAAKHKILAECEREFLDVLEHILKKFGELDGS